MGGSGSRILLRFVVETLAQRRLRHGTPQALNTVNVIDPPRTYQSTTFNPIVRTAPTDSRGVQYDELPSFLPAQQRVILRHL